MGRSKFIIGGVLILAAVVYLIVSSTQASAEYFMTIDELKAGGQSVVGRSLRLSTTGRQQEPEHFSAAAQ